MIIQITSWLRLRKFDQICDEALGWYQDPDTVRLVDGESATPYSCEQLKRMYHYLENYGELYYIEILEDGNFKPIGDVTFHKEDMPIVLGDLSYRGRGIGKLVISTLINHGTQLGYDTLYVKEIYNYNEASIKLFTSCGFKPYKKTKSGHAYMLELNEKTTI